MPRLFPTGLAEALKRGTLETHSTLELTLPDSATGARTLYFATAPVTVAGVKHSPQLRDTSAMKQSLTRAADRVTIDLQNIDMVLGIELINASESFYGARVRFGRYWRDIGSGAIFHKYLLTGAVVGVDVNETTARLALVSDAYAALNVGAAQPVVRNCRWEVIGGYKGPQCGSTSDFLTCNYLLDHADGCSARHSGTNNRARFGGFAYIKSQASVAGAAGLAVPAVNQLVKDDSATYQQRTSIQFVGAPVSDDSVNDQTVVNLSAAGREYAIHAVTDFGAIGDGTTDSSAEIDAAVAAAVSEGRALYFPAGTYLGANLSTLTNYVHIFGDGPQRTILKANASNTPVIDISDANSRMIVIEDLTVEGDGPSSGSSGHGIYIHGNSAGTDNIFLRNVFAIECGGNGINIDSMFTVKLEGVFVSNCGEDAIDISGGNTVLFDTCYVDDVPNGKTGYRVRAGQLVMTNCNGIDSLGSTSNWAVLGQQSSDGDSTDTYVDALLIGCNIESFKNYGVKCKSGSRASYQGCFFTTSASGSDHVAIYHNFTNNQVGILDAQCRFNVQGSGAWADGYAIHSGNDIPLLAIGRTSPSQYYNDSLAAARNFPVLSTVAISTNPHTYAPALATDGILFPTDNAGDIGASGANRPRHLYLGSNLTVGGTTALSGQATQTASVAGFLGLTTTNSNSSGQAGFYGVNHTGKNVFLQVFQDGTGIAQLGSDHFPLYVKAEGNNRWYFANGLFSPLQDDTSDLGGGSTRIKDGYFAGSLNLKERTAPSAPAANTLVVYALDDSGTTKLAYQDSAGTQTIVSGGSGANTALSNLASVAINTTLVSDTNNTDDLGSSAVNWKDLYLAGTFALAARSDPGSPTDSDIWRSSTRNAISARISGQTEDLSATMWRSSAQSSFDTTSAATSVIADTGVGTKTIAANRLVVGNQIRITAGGLYGTKAASAGTLTMRVRTGGTTMVTAVFTLPDGLVDQAWSLEAVGAVNTASSSGVIYWRLAWLITDSSGVVYMPNVTTNSTAINTTTSRALDVTAQFSASDADNYFQTDNATIEVLA